MSIEEGFRELAQAHDILSTLGSIGWYHIERKLNEELEKKSVLDLRTCGKERYDYQIGKIDGIKAVFDKIRSYKKTAEIASQSLDKTEEE